MLLQAICYSLYGIDALLAIEDASLQVEAGEGGGPISVFTGSCLFSGLEWKLLFKIKKEKGRLLHGNGRSATVSKKPAMFYTSSSSSTFFNSKKAKL